MDPAVVNFHRHALARPRALYDRIMRLIGTRRGVRDSTGSGLDKDEYTAMLAAGLSDGLDGAARFHVVSHHSYSGKIGSYARPRSFTEPTCLLHPLPRNVTVLRGDALRVVEALARGARPQGRGKGKTFVYLDPPYYLGRRSNYYRHAEFDHARLAAALQSLPSPWLLSYNDAPEVRSLYARNAVLALPILYRSLQPSSGDTLSVRRGELLLTPVALPARVRARVLARFDGSLLPKPSDRSQRIGAQEP